MTRLIRSLVGDTRGGWAVLVQRRDSMNIDDLMVEPEFLEETRRAVRMLIADVDREAGMGESEWFCRECGALLEDEFDRCPDC